jgi:hypothetical protein
MRRVGVAILFAAHTVLFGCNLAHRISTERVGLGDRCIEIVKAAMPLAVVRIDKSTVKDIDIDRLTAQIEGARTGPPKDVPIVAECEFTDNALTGFHWIKGGPKQGVQR